MKESGPLVCECECECKREHGYAGVGACDGEKNANRGVADRAS